MSRLQAKISSYLAFLIFLSSLYLWLAPYCGAAADLNSFQTDGATAWQNKNYDKSLMLAKLGLKNYPLDPSLTILASHSCVYLDKPAEAMKFRDQALALPNLSFQNYSNILKISSELEDYKIAYSTAKIALKKFPNSTHLRLESAMSSHSLGYLKESRQLFQNYLALEPSNFSAWLELMDISKEMTDWLAVKNTGDKMEQVAAKNKVVQESIIYARCLAAKADGHIHLEQWQQARSCLERAIKIIPLERPILAQHLMVCTKMHDTNAIKNAKSKLAEFDNGL